MQRGPVPGEELPKYGVKANTQVWAEGMSGWMPASQVQELKAVLPPVYTAPQNGSGYPVKPDNNLVWAILCTVMCCLPLGIVAIMKANEVDTKWNIGDYAGARKAADDSKKWSLWGAIGSGIFVFLYILIYVIVIVFAVKYK